jgi:hypothetical protein
MSTIRFASVLALGYLLTSCTENTVVKFDSGVSGTGGDTGTGGSSATGGSVGTGGGSGGSTGGSSGSTGGSSGSTGGAPGGADSGAPSGSDGGGSVDGSGGSKIFGGFNFRDCMTVMSGLTPAQVCSAYASVCMFGKAGYYASMADCMTKFKGMSNDGDACKAGKVCNAVNGLKDLDTNCKMAVGTCDKSY